MRWMKLHPCHRVQRLLMNGDQKRMSDRDEFDRICGHFTYQHGIVKVTDASDSGPRISHFIVIMVWCRLLNVNS